MGCFAYRFTNVISKCITDSNQPQCEAVRGRSQTGTEAPCNMPLKRAKQHFSTQMSGNCWQKAAQAGGYLNSGALWVSGHHHDENWALHLVVTPLPPTVNNFHFHNPFGPHPSIESHPLEDLWALHKLKPSYKRVKLARRFKSQDMFTPEEKNGMQVTPMTDMETLKRDEHGGLLCSRKMSWFLYCGQQGRHFLINAFPCR